MLISPPTTAHPRRLRRGLLVALAGGLLAPLLAIPTQPATAAPTQPAAPAPAVSAAASQVAAAAVPTLRWRACGEEPGFQCATAVVPLDYDDPTGPTITLALARLQATDPARRIGSLFINPGGPGGSGVDFVLGAGPVLYSDEVRARFDLVGFDPRGIAGSTPLRCFASTEEAFAATAPFAFPVRRPEQVLWQRADNRIADACDRRGNAILDHMSTANVARDMDLLRQAVGDAKMTFVGYSYGSYVGSTYANLFPDKVRAVIIDGVIDPIAWATGRGGEAATQPVDTRLQSFQGAFETMQQFLSLCDRGGRNCAFSAGDPRVRWAQLADRLRLQPLRLPDGDGGTFTLTYQDVVSITLGSLYAPETWYELAEFLQAADEASSPRRTAAALAILQARLGVQSAADRREEESYQNFVEGFPGVTCSDSDNPDTFDAWRLASGAAERVAPNFGRIWTWFSSICAVWPGVDADRYTGPFNRRTASVVLVIGTRFDPATRYQDAVSTAGTLARDRLLTLEGQGHTSLFSSSCIDDYASRYLLSGALPPVGAVCQPDVVPFAQPQPALRATTVEPALKTLLIPPQVTHPLRD